MLYNKPIHITICISCSSFTFTIPTCKWTHRIDFSLQSSTLRSQFFFAFFHLGFCFGVPSIPLRLHRNPHPFKSYFFLISPSACIKIGRKSVSLQSFTLARWLRPPFGKGDFRLTDILLPRLQCSLLDFGCKDKSIFANLYQFLSIA